MTKLDGPFKPQFRVGLRSDLDVVDNSRALNNGE